MLTAKEASAKRGGPMRSGALRDEPTPSRGMPSVVSMRPLPFSSCITAIAQVPGARPVTCVVGAVAGTEMVRAPASPRQSGKRALLRVRQISTLPRVERRLVMLMSTSPVADADWGADWLSAGPEIDRIAISAAQAVPVAEIEAIVAAILPVMPLMMACCYQPLSQRSMNDTVGKHFPAHMIADAHHRHDREDEAEQSHVNGDEVH